MELPLFKQEESRNYLTADVIHPENFRRVTQVLDLITLDYKMHLFDKQVLSAAVLFVALAEELNEQDMRTESVLMSEKIAQNDFFSTPSW